MASSWFDPRVPAIDQCVLRPLLEKWASQQPDAVFVLFEDGTKWTWRQTLEVTRRTATGLQTLGVAQGDNVLSWLPNGPDALRVWLALNYLGAVYVPVNTAYRAKILEHVISNSGAQLLIAHPTLVERLKGIATSVLRDLVVTTNAPILTTHDQLRLHSGSALDGDPAALRDNPAPILPWHTQSIIYTSGTTGPSKGVESSYLHLYSASSDPFPYLDKSDRYLVALPLFHVGGTVAVYAMLLRGASIAIVDSFQLGNFWDTVSRTQSTYTVLLGSMATLLAKQPPSVRDREHGLRHALMVPLSEDTTAFRARFGCDIYTVFNMTEISSPLMSERNPGQIGSCGRPRSGVEVRVVDENDCEVARGNVGELIVRSDRPWAMTHGYRSDPAATARAWRNGWFHTGDAFRTDEAGNYYFIDRIKDAIRRRGENISSFEVETEVCSYPTVQEAAAVAVPSPLGEDEVLIAVVPVPGEVIDPTALLHHLIHRMPHFMVPRYVRFLPSLPKTPTQKVLKQQIRAEGVTSDTWDREAAGIKVHRQKL